MKLFDKCYSCTFQGQEAYTEGHIIIVGKPPTKPVGEKKVNDTIMKMISKHPRATSSFEKVYHSGLSCIRFAPNCKVEVKFVRAIKKAYPKAEFFIGNILWNRDTERLLIAMQDKKIVAIVAPVL
jgi:hypothetical protein